MHIQAGPPPCLEEAGGERAPSNQRHCLGHNIYFIVSVLLWVFLITEKYKAEHTTVERNPRWTIPTHRHSIDALYEL